MRMHESSIFINLIREEFYYRLHNNSCDHTGALVKQFQFNS
ncbi:hypothetical protein QSI_2028 [Clostridioides difficile P28]|nr:hypothetical protein QSI_2028 [Clostridioides difficile P28]